MKFIFAIFSLFLIPGSAIGFWQGIILISNTPDIWKPVLIGVFAGVVLYWLIIRKLEWFATFEHELTHAVVALLFFRRIQRFVVSGSKGGYVQYSTGLGGQIGNFFIQMAPYYFPTFSIILVLFRPIIPSSWFPWYDMITGFTLGFHFLNTISETKLNWTKRSFRSPGTKEYSLSDIGSMGYITSFLVIAGLGLFIHSFIFWNIKYGYAGFLPMMKTIIRESYAVYSVILLWIYHMVLKIYNQYHQ